MKNTYIYLIFTALMGFTLSGNSQSINVGSETYFVIGSEITLNVEDLNNSGTVNIDGNFSISGSAVSSGSIAPASGSTITYNGDDQTILALNYDELSFSGSTSGCTKTFADGTTKVDQEISLTDAITLTGSSATAVTVQVTTPGAGGTASRVFKIDAGTNTVNISNMTIKGGDISAQSTVDNYGGSIYNTGGPLNLESVTIDGSKAAYGGGMLNADGILSIDKSTIRNCEATSWGGGIRIASGTATINNTTINDNTTGNYGGGVSVKPGVTSIDLANCTVSDNICTSTYGGGLHLGATSTLINCTVVDNQCDNGGTGDGINFSEGGTTLTLKNNLVANNGDEDISLSGGTLDDLGGNIVETSSGTITYDVSTITGNQTDLFGTGISATPSLADNNSLNGTQTIALESGSVAINAGIASGAPTTDQRGLYRNGTTDIGAFEYGGILPSAPTLTTTAISTYGSTSATMGGNITAIGSSDVTERGVVYSITSTNNNPEIGGTGVIKNTNGSGTGTFSESIGSLTPLTTYSVQAYAINSEGTAYGGVESFTTNLFDGSGTEISPYEIANLSDLQTLSLNSSYWDKWFIQTADIDAGETSGWNGGDGLYPIGYVTPYFTGNYNGQDYTISNLTIDRAATDDVGLFGIIAGGTVKNLSVTGASISGNNNAGICAGQIDNGSSLSNIHVSGMVAGSADNIGGFAGYVYMNVNINSCSSSATVSGYISVGGFVGRNVDDDNVDKPTITNSYVTGNVTCHKRNGGGFVGWNTGIIQQCYATGNVHGTDADESRIGGFAGAIATFGGSTGEISNCYASGNLTKDGDNIISTHGIGGFVGTYYAGGAISNSYSTGSVPLLGLHYGGFAGRFPAGTSTNNFWDTQTSGQTGSDPSGATGKTTTEMKTESTFTSAGWDFVAETANGTEDIWVMNTHNDGYPWLKWQGENMTAANWTGEVSSDWNAAGNWSTYYVPHTEVNVTVPGAKANDPEISSTVQATCNNLTVESGASLTVKSDATGTGSLIVNGTSTGDVTTERYLTADHWHYISAPVSGQTINNEWMDNNSIVSSPTYQFFRYDEDQAYWIIYTSDGNPEYFTDGTFLGGKGYTTTRSEDGILNFSGPLNTSTVNFAVTYTHEKARGMNLAGNPFSSTIAITEEAQSGDNFLADNAGILDDSYQAIYIWQESSGYTYGDNDYKVICNTGFSGQGSGAQLTEDFIQPGQAFMVKVKEDGNIVFNPDIRVHGSADFYKSKESWPGLELHIEGNGQSNSAIIAFHQDMTTGLDPSYDVVKMKGNPDLAIYTILLDDDGGDYAVQALPEWNPEDFVVPVGVDISETAVYEFSVYQELMEGYQISLEDRELGTTTNLREKSYATEISMNGTGRFFLHFKDLTGTQELPRESMISLLYRDGKIHIRNPENQKGVVRLINVAGQVLDMQPLSGDRHQELSVHQPAGIYIFSIQTNKAMVSRKIFIK